MFTKISSPNFGVVIVFVCILKLHLSERRISGGRVVEGERTYMVYFLKSNTSHPMEHEEWTCGGALITKQHILTSAACLYTFEFIYAIAGYHRYVNSELIDLDTCTSKRKKKIVKICVPKSYKINYTTVQMWANADDIGLAVVESPYDFNDESYMIDCSYIPSPIPINFGVYAQTIGNDVVELGWGHISHFKMPYHVMDHNEEFLREASTVIVNNSVCQEKFFDELIVENDIHEKFICTAGKGNIDSEGNILDYDELIMGCSSDDYTTTFETPTEDISTVTLVTKKEFIVDTVTHRTDPISVFTTFRTTTPIYVHPSSDESSSAYEEEILVQRDNENNHNSYEDDSNQYTEETSDYSGNEAPKLTTTFTHQSPEEIDLNYYYDAVDGRDFTRKSATDFLKSIMKGINDKYAYTSENARKNACRRIMHKILRRQSICQNDHGAPLVAWLGDTQVVIGVSITSLYGNDNKCIPPNLFVSTAYHPWFIRCTIEHLLNDTAYGYRCKDAPPDRPEIHEKVVNWDKIKV